MVVQVTADRVELGTGLVMDGGGREGGGGVSVWRGPSSQRSNRSRCIHTGRTEVKRVKLYNKPR
jgi:hypothetical protein